ncbi:uncharacterized protein A4U43_C02F17500 [Asparagus officinalis]|uniref:Uncharacterized protein n=1 Tax=Asparagus officinalis TaxID=4686 RepID=A0A5P1FJ77_ASPOF|nr:uncharacterized protein A4U43_C02F17500 [Asparagus officinalis]
MVENKVPCQLLDVLLPKKEKLKLIIKKQSDVMFAEYSKRTKEGSFATKDKVSGQVRAVLRSITTLVQELENKALHLDFIVETSQIESVALTDRDRIVFTLADVRSASSEVGLSLARLELSSERIVLLLVKFVLPSMRLGLSSMRLALLQV